jgi:hypothetical protein
MPQLRRAEVNKFLQKLEWLLLRKAIEEPGEGDLVGKPKPVMRAPALAELRECQSAQVLTTNSSASGPRLAQRMRSPDPANLVRAPLSVLR